MPINCMSAEEDADWAVLRGIWDIFRIWWPMQLLQPLQSLTSDCKCWSGKVQPYCLFFHHSYYKNTHFNKKVSSMLQIRLVSITIWNQKGKSRLPFRVSLKAYKCNYFFQKQLSLDIGLLVWQRPTPPSWVSSSTSSK